MDIPVCKVAELNVGELKLIDPPGIDPIAVFHTEEGFFATDDLCSHQEVSLSDGWFEGCIIECPLHGACFDVRTGEPINYPAAPAKDPIRTHKVRIDADHIIVELIDD